MSRYFVDIKEKAQFDLQKLLKDEPAYYKKRFFSISNSTCLMEASI